MRQWSRWIGGIILGILLFGTPIKIAAQEPSPTVSSEEFDFEEIKTTPQQERVQESAPESVAQLKADDRRAQQDYKLFQSIIISSSLMVSLITILWFITKASHTAANIMNASALILIVFATMFIAILADTDQQLTASMGILGAIAGYVFGSMRKGDDLKSVDPPNTRSGSEAP